MVNVPYILLGEGHGSYWSMTILEHDHPGGGPRARPCPGLPCRMLLPEPYEPAPRRYPLVISLHGSGERGTDNVAQLKNGLDVRSRAAP
jgi:hypothetical protein